MPFDPTQPFEAVDQKPKFDPAKPYEPAPDATAAKPTFDPTQPAEDYGKAMQSQPGFDPVSHAANYKEGDPEYEAAFQADRAKENRPFSEQAGDFAGTAAKTAFSLAPWAGVGKFIAGLGVTGWDTARQFGDTAMSGLADVTGNDEAAVDYGRKAAQLKAENILSEQRIVEGLKSSGRNIRKVTGGEQQGNEVDSQLLKDAGIITPEQQKTQNDNAARSDFNARVQTVRNQQQLATGTPLDTGLVSDLTYTGGKPLSEEFGPDGLKAVGADPVRPLVVDMKTVAGDPTNLALAAAPGLPGAKLIAGGGAELAGKLMQIPGKGLGWVAGKIGKLGNAIDNPAALGVETAAATALHPPTAGALGLALGSKLAQKIGSVLEQQGNEFRTGTPSSLSEAAEAAQNAGQSSAIPNLQRVLGNTVVQGAATAYGMAPLNYAMAGGDPEQFAQNEVGAGIFGAGMGALHASPSLRAMDQALQGKLMEAHGQTQFSNNPNYANHEATMQTFSPDDQARINRLRSFLFGGTGTDVLVVDGKTFANTNGGDIGQDARGKISPDGSTIYLNSDAVNPGESAGSKTADTAGHEAGHAIVRYLSDMSGEADSRGLMKAISDKLSPSDVQEVAKNYWDSLENSTRGITPENRAAIRARIEASNPIPDKIIEENLSEITRRILSGEDVSKFALSKPLTEKITDTASRMLEALGMSPKIDPDAPLAFKARMVKEAARRMQDTLYDVGAKARDKRAVGLTTPELLRDLNKQLSALPSPDASMPYDKAKDLFDQRQALQDRIKLAEKINGDDLKRQFPAAGQPPTAPSAPGIAPDAVTSDALKMLQAMGIPKTKAAAAIRVANEQHGSPILDASNLANGAFRVTANGSVKPGEFIPKAAEPVTPVATPPAPTSPAVASEPATPQERRQQRESKTQPANVQPTSQTQSEPVPQSATATLEKPLAAPEAAPGTQPERATLPTRESVDSIVAAAEQQAIAVEKKPSTKAAQTRIYQAKVDALMNLIGDEKNSLHRETDDAGNTKIVGDFDLSNPIHTALADLGGGVTKEAADNIEKLQNGQGELQHIRYRSAKSSTEDAPWERVGMTTRQGEYVEDPAASRTEGTIQHKAIVPVQTVFKGGRPMEQVFTLDNLLHNAESYNNFVRTKGIDAPLADEAQMTRDAQVYAANHAHGWKGDGSAPMKGFPDSGLPRPDLNYQPDTIPADRFALMNLLMNNEDAGKYAERIKQVAEKQQRVEDAKTDAQKEQAQGVLNRTVQRMKASEEAYSLGAENNPWVDEQTGEVNQLRAKLKSAGFDTNDAFKSPFETLDPQHILESGDAPLPLQQGDIQTVRPTGFTGGAEQVEPMSKLSGKAVAAGFLPDTGKAQSFTPSAEDRNAIIEGEAPFLQRFAALMLKEDKGQLTPSEERQIDELHKRVDAEFPGGSKAFLKRYERTSQFMPDSGAPADGETPSERLTREAEQAGVSMSLETLKGLLRGDAAVMDNVRKRITEKTGKPAQHLPTDQTSGQTGSTIPGLTPSSPTTGKLGAGPYPQVALPRMLVNPKLAAQERLKKRELAEAR